jgi:excisionase family DNA binding protein
MAAVIHMFCTLQEAARRLHVSEEQIETMVQRGILREFREGPHRLLKAADVALLAETMAASRSPSSAGPGEPLSAGNDRDVRLPHYAAVAAGMNDYDVLRPRITGQPHPRRMPEAEYVTGRYGRGIRQQLEEPPVPHYRPSTGVAPLSVREWFWMGLTQDRPLAILLLFALAVLILAAVVAGICMAAKVL